jgi:hypothetical protein
LLRARATIGFGQVGLLVAAVLGVVAYKLAPGYLVDQRQRHQPRFRTRL